MRNYLLAGIIFLGLIAAGCSENNDTTQVIDEGGDGVLKITLVGSGTNESDVNKAAGTPTFESTINNYMVYVFNDNTETLEAAVNGTVGATTTVSGLSTGFTKRIVVIANQPTTFPILYPGESYTYLNDPAAYINLDYQSATSAATNGLVMVGEVGDISLSGTQATEVTIPLKRIVAKVMLGAVTLVPTGDYDIDLFEIKGVSMQRANSKGSIYGNPINNVNTFFCGVLGSYNSTVKDYLYDDLTATFEVAQPVSFGNYFYVFPNDDLDNCTLMTISATYDGDEMYLPVRINSWKGSANTDGNLIEMNKTYILNLTINELADGTTDPDVPPTDAILNVNISVADWDLTITQNENW